LGCSRTIENTHRCFFLPVLFILVGTGEGFCITQDVTTDVTTIEASSLGERSLGRHRVMLHGHWHRVAEPLRDVFRWIVG
jgi:hypothetical protein